MAVILFPFWLLLMLWLPRAPAQAPLSACQTNLRNIACAVEMYSTDWSGRYPANLALLTPDYLRAIPTCPATRPTLLMPAVVGGCRGVGPGSDVRLCEIPVGPGFNSYYYRATAEPDLYTLCCAGHHHPELEKNFPRYTANEGLNAGWPVEKKNPRS